MSKIRVFVAILSGKLWLIRSVSYGASIRQVVILLHHQTICSLAVIEHLVIIVSRNLNRCSLF